MFDDFDYKNFCDENKHFQKKIVKYSKEKMKLKFPKLLKDNNILFKGRYRGILI